ncbi:MAG: NTP transferase domain-containing protein [Magnetococcus sp. DMHC-1]
MQIIIPMAGFGERFRRAGYTLPKPLIPVDGKPIVAHVLDLFPGENDITCICNRDHLANPDYRMADIIHQHAPTARILAIAPHKLGPIQTLQAIRGLVDLQRPVVVNYCDFSCWWDWSHFKEFVQTCGCDGAIPSYRGFHPHSLYSSYYAYLRETGGWITDIQEKQPYTDNPMQEYASSGTYYFASGALLQKAMDAAMAQDLTTAGEFYVSMAYKPLLAAGHRLAVYEIQHFMQWGTPRDLADYQAWSGMFHALAAPLPPPPPPWVPS